MAPEREVDLFGFEPEDVLPKKRGAPSPHVQRAARLYWKAHIAKTDTRRRHWNMLLDYAISAMAVADRPHYYAEVQRMLRSS